MGLRSFTSGLAVCVPPTLVSASRVGRSSMEMRRLSQSFARVDLRGSVESVRSRSVRWWLRPSFCLQPACRVVLRWYKVGAAASTSFAFSAGLRSISVASVAPSAVVLVPWPRPPPHQPRVGAGSHSATRPIGWPSLTARDHGVAFAEDLCPWHWSSAASDGPRSFLDTPTRAVALAGNLRLSW